MTSLNKFLLYNILLCTIFLSCTVRVPCDDGNIKLGFISFPDTVTNVFVIRQFKKGDNFKNLLDTVLIKANDSSYKKYNDTLQVEYSFNFKDGYTNSKHGLTSEYDYEVYLPKIKKSFRLSDIDEEYKMQKKSFTSNSSTCYNVIKSYKVNDQNNVGDFTDLTIYFHY